VVKFELGSPRPHAASDADTVPGVPAPRAQIHLSDVRLRCLFDVTMRGVVGPMPIKTTCTFADFEQAHWALKDQYIMIMKRPLAFPHMLRPPQHAPLLLFSRRHLREACAGLQLWLDEVLAAGLATSPSLLAFIGIHRMVGFEGGSRCCPDLSSVAAFHVPLIAEIASFLGTPGELANFCSLSSEFFADQCAHFRRSCWANIYRAKWPAFYECLDYAYQGPRQQQDWQARYRDTVQGTCICTIEVFDREKKLGFAMSAMAARVQWKAQFKGYVATYLSASEVMPEDIPASEEHRLRFCPAAARSHLTVGNYQPSCRVAPEAKAEGPYPYQVVPGVQDDLAPGQAVEFQWKMQAGSPFGWWYGTLEALERHENEGTATATIIFGHFSTTSRWYRLEVTFGDGVIRRCPSGGYSGGMIGVAQESQERWMSFMPKQPVFF